MEVALPSSEGAQTGLPPLKELKEIEELKAGYHTARARSATTGKPTQITATVWPAGQDGSLTLRVVDAEEGPQQAASVPLVEALQAARARGRAKVADILGRPEMLSAEELADHLGATRATIHAWRKKRKVLGMEGSTRGYRFPKWQFDETGRPFPGIQALLDVFEGSEWTAYRFLMQHHPELDGETGLDALRVGRDAEVIEAARSTLEAFS